MKELSRLVLASTFARSLLIQAAWNYHTMLGTGFAFTLLPALRALHRDDPGAVEDAVQRHVGHFNAHPYLAGLAVGATLRMEGEGESPETIERFKTAVRGPLGSLGDRLVWARWLPLVALGALLLHWLGAPWWTVVLAFLVVYNVGHVSLRSWGLRTGLRVGRDVARSLADAHLGERAAQLVVPTTVALGAVMGALVAGPLATAGGGGLWAGLALLGFAAGLVGGHRVWRPAAAGVVAAVVGLLILGVLR